MSRIDGLLLPVGHDLDAARVDAVRHEVLLGRDGPARRAAASRARAASSARAMASGRARSSALESIWGCAATAGGAWWHALAATATASGIPSCLRRMVYLLCFRGMGATARGGDHASAKKKRAFTSV